MTDIYGRKTEQSHWDMTWQAEVKPKLPSKLNVSTLNVMRLLKRSVKPGSRYLEIGCAPGKMLAWVTSVLKAETSGLDYSAPGISKCHSLFNALGLKTNLYNEDLFHHRLPLASFDIVTSFGVIEHFGEPRPVIQKHLDLVAPGGIALITVPNYGGVYGSIQRYCDTPNLALHNLEIMSPSALTALVDSSYIESVRAYAFGSISPWLITPHKRLSPSVSKLLFFAVNAIELVQLLTIEAVAPLLVLEIRKR